MPIADPGEGFQRLDENSPFVQPAAVAVDKDSKTVFVTDRGAKTIWSLPTTGGEPTPLVSGDQFANFGNNGLVFFGNALYVTNTPNTGGTVCPPCAIFRVEFGTVVTTTTSTVPLGPLCGDFNQNGELTAPDAQGVLRVAVGQLDCSLEICDYNGSGLVTSSDALAILRAAVGLPSDPRCPSGH